MAKIQTLKFTVGQIVDLNRLRGIDLLGSAEARRGKPSAEVLELEQLGMVKTHKVKGTIPTFAIGITKRGLNVINSLRDAVGLNDSVRQHRLGVTSGRQDSK